MWVILFLGIESNALTLFFIVLSRLICYNLKDNRGGLMRNRKGQALVEFIIILPIILILIFCIVDFGRVISLKGDLQNITSDVVNWYQNGKTDEEIKALVAKEEIKDVNVSISPDNDYVTIVTKKTIKPITPGLSYVAKKVFDVSSSRVIKNE